MNFQLVENKTFFAWETTTEVVEGLGTGSFIIVTNLAPRLCLQGISSVKICSNNMQCLTLPVSEVRKLLVPLDLPR